MHRKKQGFTLLETMLSMALLLLLFAAFDNIFPVVRLAWQNAEDRAAAEQLLSDALVSLRAELDCNVRRVARWELNDQGQCVVLMFQNGEICETLVNLDGETTLRGIAVREVAGDVERLRLLAPGEGDLYPHLEALTFSQETQTFTVHNLEIRRRNSSQNLLRVEAYTFRALNPVTVDLVGGANTPAVQSTLF